MTQPECSCLREERVAEETAQLVDDVVGLLRRSIRRPEAHRHAADYLRGLIAEVERKNGWQLAEHLGEAGPQGVQRLLNAADWDVDAVRVDALELGDP